MPLNPYFVSSQNTQGSENEQMLLADLVEESIQIWGQEMVYLPRSLVSKDEILGEDRLSKFEYAYPFEAYVESADGFMGQGELVSKFGLMIDQSLRLSISRRRWGVLVGRYGGSILPNRPAEGDLIYFPLMSRLFEIRYVDQQNPFFQLGSLPMFKLTVELFQYSSENIDTGVDEIDAFETLKSFDESVVTETTNIKGNAGIDKQDDYGDNNKFKEEAQEIGIFDPTNPFG